MVIKNVFMEVLPDVWPMLIIILVIIVSLRLTYLITKHKKFQLHKEIIYLLAIIYLLCLFHVVTFQDSNYGTSNFTPFKEIFRYDIGSHKFMRNVMGNIILFIPYGLRDVLTFVNTEEINFNFIGILGPRLLKIGLSVAIPIGIFNKTLSSIFLRLV